MAGLVPAIHGHCLNVAVSRPGRFFRILLIRNAYYLDAVVLRLRRGGRMRNTDRNFSAN